MKLQMYGLWVRFSTSTFSRRDSKSLPPANRVAEFLLLLTLMCSGHFAHAEVRATVDRSVITENDTLTLTLELDEQNADVDLSPLERDFEVLNNARSNRISIVNGRVDSRNEWVLTLTPKRGGDLQIPSLTVGNKKTAPIAVKVVAGKAAANSNKDVFLEGSVDSSGVDVQAQLIYTLRLYHAVDLKEGTLSMPELKDAIIERLGEDATSDVVRDGRRYHLVERKYAIFPQMSGVLRIPPPEFKGLAIVRGASPFDNLFNRRFGVDPFDNMPGAGQSVRVRAKELTVDVSAPPKDTRAAWWLPAKRFTLSETWVPEQFRVGEPVTRTVVMEVDGLTAQQLPDVPVPDVAGFKQYPDQPVKETKAERNGVSALKTQKIAWVATQPGRLQLPALEIPWWDTQARKLRIASLPARTVDVLPAPGVALAPSLPQPVTTPTLAPATSVPVATETISARESDNLWKGISIAAIAAWLLTLAVWWRGRRVAPSPASPEHIAAPSPNLKSARAAVRNASDNAPQLRDALLSWAGTLWTADVPRNLASLAQRCDDESARRALLMLDQQLYAPKAESIPLHKMAEAIVKWVEQADGREKSTPVEKGLRSLYPEM